MQHETLTYEADGLTMKSELFFEPGSGPRAGVLVFPEAFGIGEHAISRAERLADALTADGVPATIIRLVAMSGGSGGFVQLLY